MFIVTWTKPGVFIEGVEGNIGHKASTIFSSLENQLLDANVSLNLFYQDRTKGLPLPREDLEAHWESERLERQVAEAELNAQYGVVPFSDHDATIKRHADVELHMRRKKWESGEPPISHLASLVWIHARSFVFAIDAYTRFFKQLIALGHKEEDLTAILHELHERVPFMREVRNTVNHIDERSMGKRRIRGKLQDIELQELDTSPFKGKILFNSVLNGNRFGCTLEDGSYGEIEISEKTLLAVLDCLIRGYRVFEWINWPQHFPR